MILERVGDERILSAWAAGADGPSATRAARLLAVLEGSDAEGVYLDTALGVIDRSLLRFYASEFASDIEGTFNCEACGEGLEVRVAVELLLAAGDPAEPSVIEGADRRWRYPTPRALLAAEQTHDRAESLVRFALDDAHAEPVAPNSVRIALAAAIAQADPLFDVTFDTECAHCGARVSSRLDVATFVLSAIADRARRILTEVDRLARAYGWTEAEVLGLPQRRRHAYLSIVGAGGQHA